MAVDQNDSCYRRGRIKQINPDGSATSRVFTPRDKDDGKLSVDLKSLTTPEFAIKDSAEFNLFEISVIAIQTISNMQGDNLVVQEDTLPDNNAHALIERIEIDDDITPVLLAHSSSRVIF